MENQGNSIRHWAMDDRPREKLLQKGAAALSHSELVAILLNHGSKNKSAVDLAKELLLLCQNSLEELGKMSVADYTRISGIGPAKAVGLAAAMELGRRRHGGDVVKRVVVQNSADIARYLKSTLKDFPYEVFAVVFLNRANRIKHFEIVSQGGITGTVADPRLILKKAIELEATSIVLSHNHPSGNLNPSKSDVEITQKIKQASAYFDIQVLDHIIVSEDGYFSFADEGIM
ncbi:MAG TPA: DNA repair protein RadC [Ferruginibacter sp.]|nr:DNA repair protein RadC [Ferruginibacter sp.]HRN80328.1 DNA repair protein RadC [Ferruginibacter sp.]HRO18507.1 DNA repair protein RadC [Ferruginibacter sp.]HRQ21572.1 DNA repair protein RadC [Ferruginibacter sp.]